MEMTFTSAQFSTDLFAMANAKDFGDKCVFVPHTVKKPVAASIEIELPAGALIEESVDTTHDVTADDAAKTNVRKAIAAIDGLILSVDADGEMKDTPDATGYIYEFTAGSDSANAKVTFTLGADAVTAVGAGKEVEIFYESVEEHQGVRIDNKTSAVGELVAKYPVYADGTESDAAGVKGHVLVRIYRCRATSMPGFDTSYKSAA